MNFDTIYSDITNKILPEIAKGLSITKDYAFDVMGRYIKFLIITDSMMLIINIVIFILSIYITIKLWKWSNSINDSLSETNQGMQYFIILVPITIFIGTGINIYDYSISLSKDILVPELRIYELYKAQK